MTTGLIICGALGKEIVDLIEKYGWDAEIVGIPAVVHVFPEQIAPKVEKHILALRKKYERLIVLFGDCGSKGALDQILEKYPDIERISGPHCYEFYSGELFVKLMEEEPGTYFLTDFMVGTFQGLIVKSMGLDRFPQLKQEYFRNSLDTLIGLLKIKLVQLKLGHRILLDTLQVSFAIWDFHKLFLTILENHINMSITLKQLRRT